MSNNALPASGSVMATKRRLGLSMALRRNSMLLILVLLYIGVAYTAHGFFTVSNQLNILRNIAVPGMISFGMALVIIVGEIDLSVGSMVALAGCVCAWLVRWISDGAIEPTVLDVAVAMVVVIALAALVGIFNGVLRMK